MPQLHLPDAGNHDQHDSGVGLVARALTLKYKPAMISEAAGGFAKGRWLAALSQTIGFRLLVAAALLAAHFWTFLGFARERFDAPFNKAPGNPPVFVSP